MLNQAVSNKEQLTKLNGIIYVNDVVVLEINEERESNPIIREYMELIENNDDSVECLFKFDADGNIIEGDEENLNKLLNQTGDIRN